MKNSQNFKAACIGGIMGVAAFFVLFVTLALKSPEPIPALPQSSDKITTIKFGVNVYRLRVDNSEYIVVINDNNGGSMAITKHK